MQSNTQAPATTSALAPFLEALHRRAYELDSLGLNVEADGLRVHLAHMESDLPDAEKHSVILGNMCRASSRGEFDVNRSACAVLVENRVPCSTARVSMDAGRQLIHFHWRWKEQFVPELHEVFRMYLEAGYLDTSDNTRNPLHLEPAFSEVYPHEAARDAERGNLLERAIFANRPEVVDLLTRAGMSLSTKLVNTKAYADQLTLDSARFCASVGAVFAPVEEATLFDALKLRYELNRKANAWSFPPSWLQEMQMQSCVAASRREAGLGSGPAAKEALTSNKPSLKPRRGSM